MTTLTIQMWIYVVHDLMVERPLTAAAIAYAVGNALYLLPDFNQELAISLTSPQVSDLSISFHYTYRG